MYRTIIDELIQWKNAPERLPLIILGARQVGKTWAMQHFAETEFPHRSLYVNFEENPSMAALFEGDIDPSRILTQLGLALKTEVSRKTLLLFDEIQAAPRALTALKYFAEKAPSQPLIASGSLLGLTMRKDAAFPVGKVTFLDLEPMSFDEFLIANGEQMIRDHIQKTPLDPLLGPNHERLIDLLKTYYIVGGMPQAVASFIARQSIDEVDRIQNDILLACERDIARHAGSSNIQKVLAVWNGIASQLAKENKKFVFGKVQEGARAREYDDAIQWLVDARMIRRVVRITEPQYPLKGFEDPKAFKLYHLDIGLLRKAAGLESSIIAKPNELFAIYKGAFTEQFAFQQIAASRLVKSPHYWTNPAGTAEVDCVFQHADHIFPLEMKAGINTHARSLATYLELHRPLCGIRTSMKPLSVGDRIVDVPLYALQALAAILNDKIRTREEKPR